MIDWPESKVEIDEKRGISGIRAKALHIDPITENEINKNLKQNIILHTRLPAN